MRPDRKVAHVRSRFRILTRRRLWPMVAGATLLAGYGLSAGAQPASAANESVNVWLTSTSGSSGRTVTRGLQQQTPVAFASGHAGSGQVITVDERTRYQQFTGAGASMTDTAGYLLGSSGAISASTQASVMTALFSPSSGIGLDFLRNPMGASDLARSSYSYDDVPSGQTDPDLLHFNVAPARLIARISACAVAS